MKSEQQKLRLYKKLEHDLMRLFRYFGDLCGECFNASLEIVKNNPGARGDELCCCLLDNQVQDHWQALNAAQTMFHGPNWNKKLAEKNSDWLGVGRRRLAGNGPCPALSCRGCVLSELRPPTCSTQICPKMLRILNDLEIFKGPTVAPRQIEDLIGIKSPLNALFGLEKKEVTPADIAKFSALLTDFAKRCATVPREKWQKAIEKEQARM